MHEPTTIEIPSSCRPEDGDDNETRGFARQACRLVVVGGVAALMLAVVVALFTETPLNPTAQDCASVEDADLRLRCYDNTAHHLVSQPARGAIAPKMD